VHCSVGAAKLDTVEIAESPGIGPNLLAVHKGSVAAAEVGDPIAFGVASDTSVLPQTPASSRTTSLSAARPIMVIPPERGTDDPSSGPSPTIKIASPIIDICDTWECCLDVCQGPYGSYIVSDAMMLSCRMGVN